jgi:hypothetical protein
LLRAAESDGDSPPSCLRVLAPRGRLHNLPLNVKTDFFVELALNVVTPEQ